jgi:hypothetical protein
MRLLFSILFLSFVAPPFSQAQELKDWDWVNKHFPTVLDQLMPIHERLGFSVGYRSYRDLHTEEPEYSFVFNRILQEKYITVVVRRPDSVSIYDQMMRLHLNNPAASIEEIKKELKMNERRISGQSCAAVRRQYKGQSSGFQ